MPLSAFPEAIDADLLTLSKNGGKIAVVMVKENTELAQSYIDQARVIFGSFNLCSIKTQISI